MSGGAGAVGSPYDWKLPRGLPAPAVPADNPMTDAKVALGRRLFYDRRLSGTGTFSCASCHEQQKGFADGRARAVGATGARHARSAMSLTNVAYNLTLGWADEAVTSLEAQMAVPLFNEHPVEMGVQGRTDEIVARFAASPADAAEFRAVFPESPAVSLPNIVKAVAAFERTLLSGDSPLDRNLYRDDRAAMPADAVRGLQLFSSDRLRCTACHSGFNFSGPVRFDGGGAGTPVFHNTGLVVVDGDTPGDLGLFDRTRHVGDRGRFRAPTLRNVAVTAPYMHDGSLPTLDAVVAHYAAGGRPGTNPSRMMRPFTITPAETADLVAFLRSLTDDAFLRNPAFADPAASSSR
jgi:cytochrome c peroxidase